MTSVTEENWDRTCLHLSSKCVEPICFASWCYFRLIAPLTPGTFDNCANKITEIAFRSFLVLAAACSIATIIIPLAIVCLGILSKVLRAVGFMFQSDHFTHVRGSAVEKSIDHQLTVMTWNVCGIPGGLHYNHGGVVGWRARLERIVETILNQDPDVLVLQEIYDTELAEALINKLKMVYAHFFIHLGANVMGSVGGLMIFSKCAVHRFKNVSFSNNSWQLNRTFASLEILASPLDHNPCAKIIGTHLIDDDYQARLEQIDQILESQNSLLPIILMGDLNMERDDPKEGGHLALYFEPSYTENEPTRTNRMLKKWDKRFIDPGDFIDYISSYRGSGAHLNHTRLVRAYGPDFDTQTALSDHHGLVAQFSW